MKETLILKTNEDIRTMTDPYRIDIIRIFSKYDATPLTVKDVASYMNEPHGKVYYHIKKLLNIEALKLDHTEKVNGIVAKYYALNFKNLNFEGNQVPEAVSADIITNQTATLVSKMYDECKKDHISYIHYLNEYKESLQSKNISDSAKKFMADMQLSFGNMYFTPETYKGFKEEVLALLEKYKTPTNDESEFEKEVLVSIYSDVKKISPQKS